MHASLRLRPPSGLEWSASPSEPPEPPKQNREVPSYRESRLIPGAEIDPRCSLRTLSPNPAAGAGLLRSRSAATPLGGATTDSVKAPDDHH